MKTSCWIAIAVMLLVSVFQNFLFPEFLIDTVYGTDALVAQRRQGPHKTASGLIDAAYAGDAATVSNLLARGANVHETNQEGATALMASAIKGHVDVAKILIRRGAKVNAKDNQGWTALIYASQHGHLEMVEFLLKNGAQADLTTRDGGAALTYAEGHGHQDVVSLLKTYRARSESATSAFPLAVSPPQQLTPIGKLAQSIRKEAAQFKDTWEKSKVEKKEKTESSVQSECAQCLRELALWKFGIDQRVKEYGSDEHRLLEAKRTAEQEALNSKAQGDNKALTKSLLWIATLDLALAEVERENKRAFDNYVSSATAHATQAADVSRKIKDQDFQVHAHWRLAGTYAFQGDAVRAAKEIENCAQIERGTRSLQPLGVTLIALGKIWLCARDYRKAETCLTEAQQISHKLGMTLDGYGSPHFNQMIDSMPGAVKSCIYWLRENSKIQSPDDVKGTAYKSCNTSQTEGRVEDRNDVFCVQCRSDAGNIGYYAKFVKRSRFDLAEGKIFYDEAQWTFVGIGECPCLR